MVDEPSSLGEAVMLGAGSIEHRELIYYTVSKSTTFEPPVAGPVRSRVGLASAALCAFNRNHTTEKALCTERTCDALSIAIS